MEFWFWWWLLFVIVLLLLPIGYGWGFRGWGPPYPSYYRRRRSAASTAPAVDPATDPAADPAVATTPEERSGWGVLDDVLWVLVLVALVWLVVAVLV